MTYLTKELDKIFYLFPRSLTFPSSVFPYYNVISTDDSKITIEIALAGFKKENLSVSLEQNYLTVTGTKSETDETKTYLYKGISEKSFKKQFDIQGNYSIVNATFSDGILSILLEKIEKDIKTINIQ